MRGHRRVIRAGSVQGAEAGSATVLNPKSIFGSALELWLRADMGITLNAGRVSAWADQSGSGDNGGAGNHHPAQAVAGNQPLWNSVDASYNSQSTITFDKTRSDWLVSPVWTTAPVTTGTYFVVGNFDNSSQQVMVAFSNTGNAEIYINSAATDLHFFQGTDVPVAGEADTSVKHIYAIDRGSAVACNIYQDNITALMANQNSGTNALSLVNIGNNNGAGGVPLNGKIAEVISVNRVATAAERAATMRYLGSRYGITVGP